jgi:(p)ppGpp synthase/HD superfamily hydrolase
MNPREAINFIKQKYQTGMDFFGDGRVKKAKGIAEILKQMGYGLDVQVTAILMDIQTDVEVTDSELMEQGSMEVLQALKLLARESGCAKEEYMQLVIKSILAHPVKLAEHLYRLRNGDELSKTELDKLIRETEDYYLKCAKDTDFYEAIFEELVRVKGIC